MSYPDAYCVRCKTHTDTMGKHTVILSNKRRALKGVCPVCATENYRLMPHKKEDPIQAPPISVVKSPIRKQKDIARPGATEVPVFKSELDPISRVEINREVMAHNIRNYGMLMTIFGLSIACGFMICIVLFRG